jgi:hypothetical protein
LTGSWITPGGTGANWSHIIEADGVLHAVWTEDGTLSYSWCNGSSVDCEDWGDTADTGGLDDQDDVIDLPDGYTHKHGQIVVDTDGNIFVLYEQTKAFEDDAVAVAYQCADDPGVWTSVQPSPPDEDHNQGIGYEALEGWTAISLDYSEEYDIRVDIVYIEDDGEVPNQRNGYWASTSVCDDLCPDSDLCPE